MDREKEIKLTEQAVLEVCPNSLQTSEYISGIGCADRGVECDCFCRQARIIEAMIKAGYRKADEVEKETARKILGEMWNFWYKTQCQLHFNRGDNRILIAEKAGASNVCDKLLEEIKRQRKKYGVEVDE